MFGLLVGFLSLVAFTALGCEGNPDRSLQINAYPPIDQASGKVRPVMTKVEQIRLGVFERVGNDYRTTAIYQFPQLIKDYYSCETDYAMQGQAADVTVRSCQHCVEGQCESTDQGDVPQIDNFLGLCAQAASSGDANEKCIPGSESQQLCVTLFRSGPNNGSCNFDYAMDETAIASVDLEKLPSSETNPYTYVIEGFGQAEVETTDQCTANQSREGWVCKQNRQGLSTWFRVMSSGVVARGISGPTIYSGDDASTVDVLFSLVNSFGVVSTPAGEEGEASLMTTGRYGHRAIALPDGKALLIGGEVTSGASQPQYPPHAELFDSYTNSFVQVDINGWTGRSFFTLTELPRQAATVEGEESLVQFVIIGGQTAGGQKTGDIFVGSYNPADQTVAVQRMNTNLPPVAFHTATLLQDGTILILGGQTDTGGPIPDAFIFDPQAGSLANAGQMEYARYKHTATLTPSGKVVIVGGYTVEGNNTFTTSRVEVYTPLTQQFSRYVYGEGEVDNSPVTSRVGHIAVLLARRQSDGTVAAKDFADARVAIYGGFRFATDQDLINGKNYYNIPVGQADDVIVAFVDDQGKVESTSFRADPGYYAAMTQGAEPSPHPAVESEWIWLGNSTDTIFLVGGRRNNESEFSDWAEIIRFEGSGETGYALGSFKFGPDGAFDRVQTPFRVSMMTAGPGRWGHTVVQLDNGMILVTGGKTYRRNQVTTLNSAEQFNPPSYNRWGNVFQVVTQY